MTLRSFALALLPLLAFSPVRAAESPPNFVIILADDLGYGDLGCYGSKTIATPRLDRMAREGLRFTDAYAAAPLCSPARAGLLTGRLPARCGLPYVLFPPEHHGLPGDEITLAEALRNRGYATACVGKWHLGWDSPFRPLQQGFDVFLGLPYPNNFHEWKLGAPYSTMVGLQPLPLIDGDKVVEAPVDQTLLTRRYTERAVKFLRENKARPFFLYVPHTMPHVPQHASPEFVGKSRGGIYGDAVEEIDWSTGVLLDTLRELKLADRTLVIFTSDNGADGKGRRASGKPAASKGILSADGSSRGSGGSNGILRGGKGETFEGGVRVPFIAWWPGTIAPRGDVSEPITHLDLFPTCLGLARTATPPDRILDGVNLAPLLLGAGRIAPRAIFYYFGYQAQAVREGNWKLFLKVDSRPEPRPVSLWFEHQPRLFDNQHRLLAEPELYDLVTDPGETKNVAAQHPKVVTRLAELGRNFDSALQRDKRPMQFVAGPPPPALGVIRTPETDLSLFRPPP